METQVFGRDVSITIYEYVSICTKASYIPYIPIAESESRKIQHACRTFSSISPYNLQLRSPIKKEVNKKPAQKPIKKPIKSQPKPINNSPKPQHFWVIFGHQTHSPAVATTLNNPRCRPCWADAWIPCRAATPRSRASAW